LGFGRRHGRPLPDLAARGLPGPPRRRAPGRPRRAGRAARRPAPAAGRGRMMERPHVSVLLAEVMEALEPAPGKLIVDGTFGAGGYARAFVAAGAEVIAFDRDPSAARFAAGLDVRLVEARFSKMA